MIDIYKEMFPNRGMNHQILKSSLCERGIDWDKEIRGDISMLLEKLKI